MTDASLTIYKTRNIGEIEGLDEIITSLQSKTPISIDQLKVPAVVGELAGIATDILLSDPLQAIITAVEVGGLLWGIVQLAKRAGKHIRIGKGIARPILLSKAHEEIKNQHPSEQIDFETIKVWGPMAAEPMEGNITECYKSWDEATDPIGYFMGIIIPRPRNRAKTLWYLLGAGGELCGSWATQTFIDRLPDFIKPNIKQTEQT